MNLLSILPSIHMASSWVILGVIGLASVGYISNPIIKKGDYRRLFHGILYYFMNYENDFYNISGHMQVWTMKASYAVSKSL